MRGGNGFLVSRLCLPQHLVYHPCWTIFLANAATDAEVLVNHGVATLVDADGISRANLHANPACHAAVAFILSLVFRHRYSFSKSSSRNSEASATQSGHSLNTFPVPMPLSSLH